MVLLFSRTNNCTPLVFLDSWIDNSIGDFLHDASVFDKENATKRETIPLLEKKNKVVETVCKCYPLSGISCKQIQTVSQDVFDKQMTSVPEIFEEKEATHFTVSNITVMCLSLVAFVMLVCKLERIIATIVTRKPADKYNKNNRRWTSESQEFLNF